MGNRSSQSYYLKTTSTYTLPNDVAENTVYEWVNTENINIASIWLDLVNITQDGTIKLYHKIDGTNYREVDSIPFTVASDSDGFLYGQNFAINSSFKLTYTASVAEGATRDLVYCIIYNLAT